MKINSKGEDVYDCHDCEGFDTCNFTGEHICHKDGDLRPSLNICDKFKLKTIDKK